MNYGVRRIAKQRARQDNRIHYEIIKAIAEYQIPSKNNSALMMS